MGMTELMRKGALNRMRSGIKKTIKDGRVIFTGAEEVRFTDKAGKVNELTLDAFAVKAMDQMGLTRDTGSYVGGMNGVSPAVVLNISVDDIKKIIVEEYNKCGGKK